MARSRSPEAGLQLPFLEGVSATVPTKEQVERTIGFGLTDNLYTRLLNKIAEGDTSTWQQILERFREEDSQPDHPWS